MNSDAFELQGIQWRAIEIRPCSAVCRGGGYFKDSAIVSSVDIARAIKNQRVIIRVQSAAD